MTMSISLIEQFAQSYHTDLESLEALQEVIMELLMNNNAFDMAIKEEVSQRFPDGLSTTAAQDEVTCMVQLRIYNKFLQTIF